MGPAVALVTMLFTAMLAVVAVVATLLLTGIPQQVLGIQLP
jgi:hypothetical protein